MRLRVIFDLDGTLADTEPLVRQAYASAGVEVPSDAWGLPASQWLPQLVGEQLAREVHELKNIAYRMLISVHGVQPLPAAALCRKLMSEGYDVGIATGASHDAASRVRQRVGLASVPLLGVGLTTTAKAQLLQSLGDSGVYFDDNLHACRKLAKDTSWNVVFVSRSASVSSLRRELEEAECTQLS